MFRLNQALESHQVTVGFSSIWLISALTSTMQSTGQSIPCVLDSFNWGPLEDTLSICSPFLTGDSAGCEANNPTWTAQKWTMLKFWIFFPYMLITCSLPRCLKLSENIHLALMGNRGTRCFMCLSLSSTPLSSIMMCLQQFERARNLHIRLILLHVISVRLRKAEEGERGEQRGVGGKMH